VAREVGAVNPTGWPYRYAWGNNPVRAARKGQPCRVLIRSLRMSSVLVEFPDGFQMVTSRRALRTIRK
jgi:hypothetical protein